MYVKPGPSTRDLRRRPGFSALRRSLYKDFGGHRVVADVWAQIELGTACGKLFRCSTMAILDAGDSDILSGSTQ